MLQGKGEQYTQIACSAADCGAIDLQRCCEQGSAVHALDHPSQKPRLSTKFLWLTVPGKTALCASYWSLQVRRASSTPVRRSLQVTQQPSGS